MLQPICCEILVILWVGFSRSLYTTNHVRSLCQRGTLEWNEVCWELLQFSSRTSVRNSMLRQRVMGLQFQQSC